MTGSSAKSFQVGMNEADLNLCRAAGVDPAELVREAVRAAIADLVPVVDEEEESEAEEDTAAAEEEEEEPVAEEEEENVEAPSYPR